MTQERERLLNPKEAAALLGVTTATVFRWAEHGMLTDLRTLGGQRRYLEREILTMVLRQERSGRRNAAS